MGNNSELFKVKTLAEAIYSLKPYVQIFYQRAETIALEDSLGRILTQDIPATCAIPHFRKSTMDGMAVRALDTFGASESMPALVQCYGEVRMGEAPKEALKPGTGILIPTGGMLPEGADAVVMVEHLEHFGEELYGVTKAVAPGENLIEIGEDVTVGEVILTQFTRIRAQEMGLLASLGQVNVSVLPRFRVGILSTGDEIISPDKEPLPGQSRDINGYTLLGQALASGAEAHHYGIVKDDLEELRTMLTKMLKENDIVLLSGGSSVGTRDLSAQLIDELGDPGLLFHGLALKPGKPTIGGVVDGKLIFGLPGHPASAMVVFDAIVRPWLDGSVLCPQANPLPKGKMTQNLYSGSGREEFVRIRLIPNGEEWLLEPIRGKSGLIRTMVLADAVVHIPLDTEGIEAGKENPFSLLR
ncbi:molybdenum cofactor synthesis domain protein [Desulfosporosinus orientis DSM 765]|uniref:Molybdopterin molybdenumtransferase n=1 Tax=Desulfosporosinus orientis (strain ATCC 19365 / DSM 765 / NCIMB 8382 / VKM B-1628 / Singapore I) TaxID=768706 RepID=G7WEQ9_DESOD|nr:gephyrin-like molybdotransferase Glp [Desulfosporosinus orientis]AET66950.1 molybdenum cofactor synthesis domain protein [Desulfosporosinus orientis DSM 765]